MRSREQTVRKKQISNTYLKTCVEDKNDLKITALTQVLEAILIIFFLHFSVQNKSKMGTRDIFHLALRRQATYK